MNLKKLKPDLKTSSISIIRGTGIGLIERERETIKEKIMSLLNSNNVRIETLGNEGLLANYFL